jgi:hypothetical protein
MYKWSNEKNLVVGTIFKAKFYSSKERKKINIIGNIVHDFYDKNAHHFFKFVVNTSSNEEFFKMNKCYQMRGKELYPRIRGILYQPENIMSLANDKRIRKYRINFNKRI